MRGDGSGHSLKWPSVVAVLGQAFCVATVSITTGNTTPNNKTLVV